MTFADLVKGLLDSSRERMKTPISGAFFLSFIVYNWRPILILIFSKASIEDKIELINSFYCNVMALIGPFIIALLYTVAVPYIMMFIDRVLVVANGARLISSYQSKSKEIEEKIILADKELELQDKISRNKDREELLNQINHLKIENEQLKDEKNNFLITVEQEKSELNHQIQKLNSKIELLNLDNNSFSFNMEENEFQKLYNLLPDADLLHFINLPTNVNKLFPLTEFSFASKEILLQNKILDQLDDVYSFTEKGLKFRELVVRKKSTW
ncbi:MAG: hypothetical protein IR153_07500 [Flavobacterium sp.]|nr:hypothetical protein [Flavobacterium sp.]